MGDRMTAHKGKELVALLVAANAIIEAGKMVAVNASGRAVPAADAAGLTIAGCATGTMDNTGGADGAMIVTVGRERAFCYDNDTVTPVTDAHLFKDVYVKDDHTVSSAGGTNSIKAGKCLGVTTDGVWVVH